MSGAMLIRNLRMYRYKLYGEGRAESNYYRVERWVGLERYSIQELSALVVLFLTVIRAVFRKGYRCMGENCYESRRDR